MTIAVVLKAIAVWVIITLILSVFVDTMIAMGVGVFIALISLNFFLEVPGGGDNDGDYLGGGGDPGC